MPFLNPPDVLPEAMRFLLRGLLSEGGAVDEDALVRLVAPAGLVEALAGEVLPDGDKAVSNRKTGGRVIATATLAAMRGADLVVRDERGAQALAPSVAERFTGWEQVTKDTFVELLRETALATTTTEYDDASLGAEDLANALAVLLTIPDPLDPIRGFEQGDGKALADYQSLHFGSDQAGWVVRNKERYVPLVRWSTYLGVAREFTGGLVVDPSGALEGAALPLLDRELSMPKFLERLGGVMPYTDRGVVGSAVRSRVGADDGEVSPGLALGLLTLHHRGLIELSSKSDAESVRFRVDPAQAVAYSHIARRNR